MTVKELYDEAQKKYCSRLKSLSDTEIGQKCYTMSKIDLIINIAQSSLDYNDKIRSINDIIDYLCYREVFFKMDNVHLVYYEF